MFSPSTSMPQSPGTPVSPRPVAALNTTAYFGAKTLETAQSRIDPAVRLSKRAGVTAIRVNASVQALLGLDSPDVPLDRSNSTDTVFGHPVEPGDIDPNIPAAHRVFLQATHAELLQRFVDAFEGMWLAEHAGKPLPYQTLRHDIQYALRHSPARAHEVEPLMQAMTRMEGFLLHYHYISPIARALEPAPELQQALQDVGALSVERARDAALAGADPHAELLTAEQWVARAREWHASKTEVALLNGSTDFYDSSTASPVDGSRYGAARADIQRLSEGEAVFADLPTLLRFGASGIVQFDSNSPFTYMVHHGIIVRNQPIEITYVGGLLKRQSFWKDRGTADQRRVPVLLGADSYKVQGQAARAYETPMPAAVRKLNQQRLEVEILQAGWRLHPPVRIAPLFIGPHGMRDKRSPADDPPAYDPNIPPADRAYIHQGNAELLQRFVDSMVDLDLSLYRNRPLPQARMRADILFALRHSPGRQHDVPLLEAAFAQMEKFMLQYNYVSRVATDAEPGLTAAIRHGGRLAIEKAGALALAGESPGGLLVTAEEMIARAPLWAAEAREQKLLAETQAFYATTDAVEGAGPQATDAEVQSLADGWIQFRRLDSLLRYAPAGVMHIHRSRNYMFDAVERRFTYLTHEDASIRYADPLVKSLHYWENHGTPEQRRVPVMVTGIGYRHDGARLAPLPQDIPPSVREENLRQLARLVEAARRRKGQGQG